MGQKNNLKRSLIPQSASKANNTPSYIDKNASIMRSWQNGGDEASIFVSIRFIQDNYQCFSAWQKDEMGLFWDFNRRIHDTTWAQLYSQSGKGQNKTGFAITNISRDKYPNSNFIKSLSLDIGLFELRVSSKARVHGFRYESIFYLCYLDRNHEICS